MDQQLGDSPSGQTLSNLEGEAWTLGTDKADVHGSCDDSVWPMMTLAMGQVMGSFGDQFFLSISY